MEENYGPFDTDHYVAENILELKNRFNIKIAIETGTHEGKTTTWLSKCFDKVYTIDINPDYIETAKKRCGLNTDFFLGKSVDILPDILDEIDEIYLIYLDAHWGIPCPTPQELQIIAKHSKIKPVIVIHDFFNPFRPELGYDSYPDFTYDYEHIRDYLFEIYGKDYSFYHNTDSEGANRGVIYIMPIKK